MRDAQVFEVVVSFICNHFSTASSAHFLLKNSDESNNAIIFSRYFHHNVPITSHFIHELSMKSMFLERNYMNSLFRRVVTFGKWSLKWKFCQAIAQSWSNDYTLFTNSEMISYWSPTTWLSQFIHWSLWILQTHSSFLVWQETE